MVLTAATCRGLPRIYGRRWFSPRTSWWWFAWASSRSCQLEEAFNLEQLEHRIPQTITHNGHTKLFFVQDAGISGRWNFICDPTAPGRGGADRLAAAKLMASIHNWQSLLSLKLNDKHKTCYLLYKADLMQFPVLTNTLAEHYNQGYSTIAHIGISFLSKSRARGAHELCKAWFKGKAWNWAGRFLVGFTGSSKQNFENHNLKLCKLVQVNESEIIINQFNKIIINLVWNKLWL